MAHLFAYARQDLTFLIAHKQFILIQHILITKKKFILKAFNKYYLLLIIIKSILEFI